MQYFKGDALELKFDQAAEPYISGLSLQLDDFLAGAYETAPLGDMIFDNLRSPLANAIPREIFRIAFKQIVEAFVAVGTFEAYLTVFQKIFGSAVQVTFTVPGPGQLHIDIVSTGVDLTHFITRYIQDNAYVFDTMLTQAGENIVFQSIKGFTSEYDLDQMLFEMVPGGIYTLITLTV